MFQPTHSNIIIIDPIASFRKLRLCEEKEDGMIKCQKRDNDFIVDIYAKLRKDNKYVSCYTRDSKSHMGCDSDYISNLFNEFKLEKAPIMMRIPDHFIFNHTKELSWNDTSIEDCSKKSLDNVTLHQKHSLVCDNKFLTPNKSVELKDLYTKNTMSKTNTSQKIPKKDIEINTNDFNQSNWEHLDLTHFEIDKHLPVVSNESLCFDDNLMKVPQMIVVPDHFIFNGPEAILLQRLNIEEPTLQLPNLCKSIEEKQKLNYPKVSLFEDSCLNNCDSIDENKCWTKDAERRLNGIQTSFSHKSSKTQQQPESFREKRPQRTVSPIVGSRAKIVESVFSTIRKMRKERGGNMVCSYKNAGCVTSKKVGADKLQVIDGDINKEDTFRPVNAEKPSSQIKKQEGESSMTKSGIDDGKIKRNSKLQQLLRNHSERNLGTSKQNAPRVLPRSKSERTLTYDRSVSAKSEEEGEHLDMDTSKKDASRPKNTEKSPSRAEKQMPTHSGLESGADGVNITRNTKLRKIFRIGSDRDLDAKKQTMPRVLPRSKSDRSMLARETANTRRPRMCKSNSDRKIDAAKQPMQRQSLSRSKSDRNVFGKQKLSRVTRPTFDRKNVSINQATLRKPVNESCSNLSDSTTNKRRLPSGRKIPSTGSSHVSAVTVKPIARPRRVLSKSHSERILRTSSNGQKKTRQLPLRSKSAQKIAVPGTKLYVSKHYGN